MDKRKREIAIICILSFLCLNMALVQGETFRVSVASNGTQANRICYNPSISADGRYVAFSSQADNLVEQGTIWGLSHIYVFDTLTESIVRGSVATNGTAADNSNWYSDLSGDGRSLIFTSAGHNLVPNDNNRAHDVFLRDLDANITERISVATNGSEGNEYTFSGRISTDGRYVAINSYASNLIPDDNNGVNDIFIRDLENDITTRASISSEGSEADGYSIRADINPDGSVIVFESSASNLVPNDLNNRVDVFVHYPFTQTTKIVSVATDGTQTWGFSEFPAVNADGRYVVFASYDYNLDPDDINGGQNIFIRDLQDNTTKRLSTAMNETMVDGNSRFPDISGDGRFVVFESTASNLIPNDLNNASDIFVFDRLTNITERVSVASDGTEGNGDSEYPAISEDGQYIAFVSSADNLVPGDTNGISDVFVHYRPLAGCQNNADCDDGSACTINRCIDSNCEFWNCDLDGNSNIGLSDVMRVISAWAQNEGDPGYVGEYDIDGNGNIGLSDIMQIISIWANNC